ncbi:MAG TPA: apolipoprotein N-acyltransferase, partial [Bryobacteraceae bacterium]
ADYPIAAQVVSVAAPEALSFIVVAVNVSLVMAWRKAAPEGRWAAVGQGVVFGVLALGFGYARLADANDRPMEKIAVVQPMISQQIRWDNPANRPPLLAGMNRLIDRAAAERPSMIVLPEAALPALVRYEGDLAEFATNAVRRAGVPLLFGSVDRDDDGKVYNVAMKIGVNGDVASYRKQRLVPFVEHTPWPFHYTPPEGWAQFTPGTENTVMPLNTAVFFSVAMCLEDTYPDMGRAYAARGADLLIAMVNTENFKDTNQGLAHLRRARLTAIASGLPLVRAANSGISCSIDAHGRMLGSLPKNAEAVAALPVSVLSTGTFYDTVGDAGLFMALVLILAGEVWWLRLPERQQTEMPTGKRARKAPGRAIAVRG